MANSNRDGNRVTTLIATSNVDGVTPVNVWADPTTHRVLVQTVASSGVGAPGTTPTSLGQVYIDTNAAKVYVSTGTSSSGNWTLVN